MPHFNIILMILVAWLSQAQGQEIHPAKIYANRNRGKLEFTCSTYGLKAGTEKNSNFYIYLCRNGIGIDRKSSCQDAIFHMDDATTDNTGNYSCVFSVHKYNPEVVKGNGINSIFITVNDSFIPAEIALTETSVKTGTDAEFQCTSLKSPKRNQKGNIYAYLYKNSTVIQMSIWDTVKNKARFTLKEVTMQDAGTYNCFLMSEPCPFPKKVHGVNEVYLHITEYFNEILKITVGGFSLLLMIILSLGLWKMFQKQDCFKCQSERSVEHTNDLRDAEMGQGERQNEHSFASEWEDYSDSAHSLHEDIYQVCEDP